MPYVTSIDRLGREEGRREGQVRLLKRQLTRRFDQLPVWGLDQTSQAEMERWTDQILDANALKTSSRPAEDGRLGVIVRPGRKANRRCRPVAGHLTGALVHFSAEDRVGCYEFS